MSFSPKQVQAAQQHLYDVIATPNGFKHVFAPKPADPNGGWTGGTPNMRRLERAIRYIDWDMPAGLLGFLRLEESDGFELQEPFPATHDHLNYGAMGVALKVAHDRGNLLMVAVVGTWFQRAFHLCRLMDAGAAVGPWGPGARASDGGPLQGSNMGRTLAYRVSQGQKVRSKQLADKGNVGALALSLLPKDLLASLLDPWLEEPASFRLCSELRVARRLPAMEQGMRTVFPDDYTAWYPNGIKGGLDVALAAGVWDGKTFISREMVGARGDDPVQAKIALCGPPVVIPRVS